MNQSSIIFGALLVGFVVYVTTKGHAPAYAAVLFGKVQGNTDASKAASSSGGSSGSGSSPLDMLGGLSGMTGGDTGATSGDGSFNPLSFLDGGNNASSGGGVGANWQTALKGYEGYLALAAFL